MKTLISLLFLLFATLVTGQTTPSPANTSGGSGIDINIVLILLAVFLLFPIGALANAFVAAVKKKLEENAKSSSLKVLIPLGLLFFSQVVHAQAAVAKVASNGVNSKNMMIVLLSVIALEMMVMIFLAFRVSDLIRSPEPKAVKAGQAPGLLDKLKHIWARLNFKPIEKEAEIDLGHNYDGIRELDNVIPPWFTTAFLLTILFAGAYLYRYHIAKSAPMQLDELKIAVAKADLEHETYLAKQASSVDENTVTTLTGADLEAGKKIFTTICAACHRPDGGGQVGPNLTDKYWIHGGSLQNIFKTVKYGVPDKGMISWKEQLSPTQIAQVSNYILTLGGTNPPDPKEKQGVLYEPGAAATDSTKLSAPKPDSTAVK